MFCNKRKKKENKLLKKRDITEEEKKKEGKRGMEMKINLLFERTVRLFYHHLVRFSQTFNNQRLKQKHWNSFRLSVKEFSFKEKLSLSIY